MNIQNEGDAALTGPIARGDILTINDNLKALLQAIQNREALAYVQKVKKSIPTEVTELKRALADVMLLLDGVDIKAIKAKNKAVYLQALSLVELTLKSTGVIE